MPLRVTLGQNGGLNVAITPPRPLQISLARQGAPGTNEDLDALTLTINNGIRGTLAELAFEKEDRVDGDIALAERIDAIDTGLSPDDEARILKNSNDIAANIVKIAAARVNYRVVVDNNPLLLAEELQHTHYSNSQTIEFTAPTAAKAGFYADTFNSDGAIVTGGGGVDHAGIILRAVQDEKKITVHLDRAIDLGDEAFYYPVTQTRMVTAGRGGALTDDGVWVVAGRGDVSDLKDELDITIEAVVALANGHVILHDVVIGESILLGRAWTHPATDNNVITFTFDNPDSALAVAGVLRGGAIGPVAGDENDARIVVSVVATDDIHIIKVYLDGPLVVAASTSESSLIKFYRATSSGVVTRLIGFDYDADTQVAIGVSPTRLNQAIASITADTNTLLEVLRDTTIESNRVIHTNVAQISLNTLAISNKLGSDLSNYKGTRAQGEAFLSDHLFGMTTEQVATAISLIATSLGSDITESKSYYTDSLDPVFEQIPVDGYRIFGLSDLGGGESQITMTVISGIDEDNAALFSDIKSGYITINGSIVFVVESSHSAGMAIRFNIDGTFAPDSEVLFYKATPILKVNPIVFITGDGVYKPDMGVLDLSNPTKYFGVFDAIQGTALAPLQIEVNSIYYYSRVALHNIKTFEFLRLPTNPKKHDVIEIVLLQSVPGTRDLQLHVYPPVGETVTINGDILTADFYDQLVTNFGGYRILWTGDNTIGWVVQTTTGRQ